MAKDEGEVQKNGHRGGTNRGKDVSFCNADGLMSPQVQRYTMRIVLRGDVVKDDSGSYAVFTEQGSSASQVTAAIVLNAIARRPECEG